MLTETVVVCEKCENEIIIYGEVKSNLCDKCDPDLKIYLITSERIPTLFIKAKSHQDAFDRYDRGETSRTWFAPQLQNKITDY